MALNMGMLASYDQSVEFFKDFLGLGEASIVVGPSAVSGSREGGGRQCCGERYFEKEKLGQL
uniref:Uncharacterized protein n=1 Tax=Vitis vinifera TaxID=29760 RepID=F6H4E3_VITVI